MINIKDKEKISNLLKNDFTYISKMCKENSISQEDDWLYLFGILRIIQLQECEDEQLWIDFCDEILHNNRYFPESVFLNKIKDVSRDVAYELKTGEMLYRCREYKTEDFYKNPVIKQCEEFIKNEVSELEISEKDFYNSSVLETMITVLMMKTGLIEKAKEKYQEIADKHDTFWGFKANDNDAPPTAFAKSMRANPEGISYLYTAENIKTALMEMRPQLGQAYSVATIRIRDDVRLFDFTNEAYGNASSDTSKEHCFSRAVLNKAFSDPNYGNLLNYVPMQYLCEYIKKQGFDGVRFRSSLFEDGKNVVLFDIDECSRKYEIIGTEVYCINNLDIEFTKILPFPEGMLDSILNDD